MNQELRIKHGEVLHSQSSTSDRSTTDEGLYSLSKFLFLFLSQTRSVYLNGTSKSVRGGGTVLGHL